MKRIISVVVLLFALSSCKPHEHSTSHGEASGPAADLLIAIAPENEVLHPMIDEFAKQEGVTIKLEAHDAVDIEEALEIQTTNYDAVLAPDQLWLDRGDHRLKRLKHSKSMFRTPIVFAVKRERAEELGWQGRDIRVQDLLTASEQGRLHFLMTNASQADSGAMALLSFYYALSGQPAMLTADHIKNPTVQAQIRAILNRIPRSSENTEFLEKLMVKDYDRYDGMINYECMAIQANRELITAGREPLQVFYLVDGVAIADNPFAYVDKGDAAKEALFHKLQAYLLSAPVQARIQATGRRTGLSVRKEVADQAVFNPAWGIDVERILDPIALPRADVITMMLEIYQGELRKPTFTVFVLDYSGSMRGHKLEEVKSAMRTMLDQPTAKRHMLHAARGDIVVVIPFDDAIMGEFRIEGKNPADYSALFAKINGMGAGGGTDIYTPTLRALEIIKQTPNVLENMHASVILMSDGHSENGMSQREFETAFARLGTGRTIPVHTIAFGEADETQLKAITDATSGRAFDGHEEHLLEAFRHARGEG